MYTNTSNSVLLRYTDEENRVRSFCELILTQDNLHGQLFAKATELHILVY